MSFNHLIVLAVGLGAVAVAAPRFAPSLVSLAVQPRNVEEVVVEQGPPGPPQVVFVPVPQPREIEEPEPFPYAGRTVALRADQAGHYQVDAAVNGRTVEAIVDTGATTVALNAETARRVGVYVSRGDFRLPISTANGVIMAAPVTLSNVRVGGILVRNVRAVVLPGDVLSVNLLGMSFLSRLSKFEVAGGRLVLTQ